MSSWPEGDTIMATTKPRLDRRIVRSRNAILSAFERLLMEKPLADITVSAIAREANVDRKTFYVHFGTVDGLLDAIAVDVVEMIVDSVEKTLSSMSGDSNERALGAAATFFKTVNEALCNNLVLNRQLIENIPLDDFMARLRVPLEHEIAERGLRVADKALVAIVVGQLHGALGDDLGDTGIRTNESIKCISCSIASSQMNSSKDNGGL